jgi:hypothetical protein
MNTNTGRPHKAYRVQVKGSRRLHVIDLENLLGTARSLLQLRQVWATYRLGIGIHPGDTVLVASGPRVARVALFELADENLRYYIRSGIDGADQALLDHVDPRHAASRYRWLIIASGDHAFTPLAQAAQALGLPTLQVAGAGRTAKSLALACSLHARLRLPSLPTSPHRLPDAA